MDAGPPETDTHDRAHTHELHSNPSPAPTPASLHSSHTQPPHPSVETTQSQGVLPSGSRPVTAASTISACAVMSEEKVEEERENNGGAAESRAEMRVASSEPVVDARQLAQMQKGVEAEQNDGNGSKVDEDVPQLPQTSLTFLLISGRRKTMTFEPDMAVGRVKELVWNAWPAEWQDERPPSPSHLRILYLGKILQDEDTLRKLDFKISTPPAPPQPTIVHLSIRPVLPPNDDDTLKKKVRSASSIVRRGFSRNSTAPTGGQESGQGDGHSSRTRTTGDLEDGANAGGCCGCVIC